MKYSTYVKNGNLCFRIDEGQFKGITYRYKALSESNGLEYTLLQGKKYINNDNKFLFEREIKNILNHKLGLTNV